jgi:glycosyltransferase involved in cell wall biosynthesis
MASNSTELTKISVVIPAYKVSKHLRDLIPRIGSEVQNIIVVDDFCPEGSGKIAEELARKDARISVIFHDRNTGVGGAVKSGYVKALSLESDVIVKLDGDGQMNPEDIMKLVDPIVNDSANYTKGNRFYDVEAILQMPKIRIIGNLVLSFISKLSTGYWMMFDPNNGFTAINARTLRSIPLNKIDNRYFFESDMLFRLNLLRAEVVDIPLPAIYGNEVSSLSVTKAFFEFLYKHNRNFWKRITYSYFLREFTLASIEFILGVALLLFGAIFGLANYFNSQIQNTATPTGTLILIALSVLSGLQFLLGFFSYDIQMSPSSRSRYKL